MGSRENSGREERRPTLAQLRQELQHILFECGLRIPLPHGEGSLENDLLKTLCETLFPSRIAQAEIPVVRCADGSGVTPAYERQFRTAVAILIQLAGEVANVKWDSDLGEKLRETLRKQGHDVAPST